ncbi:MAG TPA: hypothetical protein VFL90_04835 [Methylomirabilota bacterium]|nr:hypothetical protein [Methylomirabilota bacterium]
MSRPALALLLALALCATRAGAEATPTPVGTPAPLQVVSELRAALDEAVARFNAGDARGVLGYVSDRYRTGGFTKTALAEQLSTLYALHDQVTARIRLDEVRMLGEQAWIYTTGDVVGRLRLVGSSLPLFSWQHEPEVARREGGRWVLFGDQN